MHRGEVLSERQLRARAWSAGAPALIWLAVFFALPLAIILLTSFWTRGEYGAVERIWTFENFQRLAGFGLLGFDPLYPLVLLRSVAMGAGTAALCLLAGLPLAFFIASLRGRARTIGLILVVIPFWTNLLIRTYAWQILLSPGGWLARVAAALGWANPGEALYPGIGAVSIGMVCDYLPFMVLPLYASVEKVDWSLAEAARDLGAKPWAAFWHGVLPQIRPGLTAGFILVLLPATGQFVIPDLLGGAKTFMLGNAIQQQFGSSMDWPFGSAMALVTLTIVAVAVWLFGRIRTERELDLL